MKKPFLFNLEKKWSLLGLSYLGFAFFYTLTGHFHLFTPIVLPLTFFDQAIGFKPRAIWIYQSQFLFLLFSYWTITEVSRFTQTLSAMIIASIIAFLIFMLIPVMFPRQNFSENNFTFMQFKFLYQIDTSANCFPSLHVALATIAVAGTRRIVNFLWAGMIIFSTLATKQHYFVDAFAGMILGVCSWHFASALMKNNSLLNADLKSEYPL